MIVDQYTDVEEDEIGISEGIEAGIDLANIAFVLDAVSTKLYSDPIGSIVRELTSNAVDANVENNSTKPVVIGISMDLENNGQYIIEFKDNGIGINDERFEKIYMKWFSSTKRNTNSQIGMFGIGSKSPFAYNDYFFITTVADGYETKYILSKIPGSIPKSEVLSRVVSNKETGTSIRIDIKSYSDYQKFLTAIKEQLRYFDNVYIDCPFQKFDNQYRIYECENFKYRSGFPNKPRESESYYSPDPRSALKVHVLLGSVVYPINQDLVNVPIYNIPIGLKFAIGELQVTPNRESLEYNDRAIKLIEERFGKAICELQSIFNRQNPVVETLEEYLKLRKEKQRITFKAPWDETIVDDLYVDQIVQGNKLVFAPLKNIEELPENFFFNYKIETIENEIIKPKRTTTLTNRVATDSGHYQSIYFTEKYDKYTNLFIGRGKLIMPKNNLTFKEQREELGFVHHKSPYNWSWFRRVSNEAKAQRPKLGSAYAVYTFNKFIKNYLQSKFEHYPVVSEQWIKDYKKQQIDNSNKIRRKENQIVIIEGLKYDDKRYEISLNEIAKKTLAFYALKDDIDVDLLRKYYDILKNTYKKEIFGFYVVNKTNYNLIKKLPNLRNVHQFYQCPELQPILNRIYFATKWNTEYGGYYEKYPWLKKLSPHYYSLYREVRNFVRKNYHSGRELYLEELQEKITIRNHIRTWKVRQAKKELELFLPKLDIFNYIDIEIPNEYLKVIMKTIKTTKIKRDYEK